MLGNLGGLVGGGGVGSLLNGGIGELLKHFKQNGQGDAAQSWVDRGPNREVTPRELSRRSVRMSCRSWNSRPDCRSRRYSTACPASCRQPWTNTRPTDGFLLRR